MGLEIRLVPEKVKTLGFASIGMGYSMIGTSPNFAFAHPIRILLIQNLTDVTLMFSHNGIDDHYPLPSNGYMILDVCTNRTVSQQFYIAEGTIIYVKQIGIPTMGTVYVSAFYGAS